LIVKNGNLVEVFDINISITGSKYSKRIFILWVISFLIFSAFTFLPEDIDLTGSADALQYGSNVNVSAVDASFIGDQKGNNLGYTWSGLKGSGDVNGDGYDDILISAPHSSSNGNLLAGNVYLFFGKAEGWSMDMNLSSADASFHGESKYQAAGGALEIPGDINGDGYDDILIVTRKRVGIYHRPYKTYLIFGKASGWGLNTNLSTADASFFGESAIDSSGASISGAGDVNGDGFDDFIIGADNNNERGDYTGQAYLIFGRSGGWSLDTNLSNANASFVGVNESYAIGYDTAGVGDVNGDGFDDFLIGGNEWISIDRLEPRAHLYYGSATGWTMDMNLTDANVTFYEESWVNWNLLSISGAGDVNGDGLDDMVIGCPGNNHDGKLRPGKTYLIFGKTTGWSSRAGLLASADATYVGEYEIDVAGYSVVGGGDVNGDGFDDVLITALGQYKTENQRENEVYIILGKAAGWPIDASLVTADQSFLGETIYDNMGMAISMVGDVNADGFDDIMIGADYNDEGGNNSGQVYLIFPKLSYGPPVVNSVKAYSNPAYTDEIEFAEIGDTVYIELNCQDANATHIDNAAVNVSSETSPEGFILYLLETGFNTGKYRGSFKIANYTHPHRKLINSALDENITISSVMDPSKSTKFLVSISVQLRPLADKIKATEDEEYSTLYWTYGFSPVTSWTFETNASWLSWDSSSHKLSGTPDNGDVGNYQVRINITDGLGNYDEHDFEIEVMNTQPEITTEDITIAPEDEYYYADYNSSDDGQGIVTWKLHTDAAWLGFDNLTGELLGTPANDDRGTYWVNVTVDDGNGGLDWSNFTLIVSDVNDDPIITVNDEVLVVEDEYYEVDYEAVDIDGETDFQWFLETNASWLTVNRDKGVLSGIPLNEHVGISFVNVTVTDSRGGSDSHNFTLKVINANDPPVWVDVPGNEKINEGEMFRFDVNASDVDRSDTITYSIYSDDNIDITIDSATGVIEWQTFLEDPQGKALFSFDLSVTDGTVTIWKAFSVAIIPNSRPTVELITPHDDSIVSFSGAEFVWEGYDDENEELTFDVYISKDINAVGELLDSARILHNTHNSSYTSRYLEIGSIYYWTVIPHDGLNYGTCLDGITDFSVNSPPVLMPIPDQKINLGLKFSYDVNANDNNNDDLWKLKYSLESAPDGMTIDSDTGMITWKPSSDQIGMHTIKVLVTDGKDTSNLTLEIEVTENAIQPKSSSQILIITTTGFSILILILSLFIAGTEVGKYKFFTMVVPMYNKLNQDKVLYNLVRGQIFGYVKAKPGDNYNNIKKSLELNNGTLAHHAKILEKEGYIKSRRDGLYTRFYPSGAGELKPDSIQHNLIEIITAQPGITQNGIIPLVKSSQQVVSYNLKKLVRENVIRVEKTGRENKYYYNENEQNNLKYQTQAKAGYNTNTIPQPQPTQPGPFPTNTASTQPIPEPDSSDGSDSTEI
jgi:predicted transcriptional regulator